MPEVEKELIIQNKLGLHARPASQFVQLTNKFSSDIVLSRGEDEVNGKSIMGVLMLAAAQGASIKIIIRGEDAEIALKEIEDLINSKFGEE